MATERRGALGMRGAPRIIGDLDKPVTELDAFEWGQDRPHSGTAMISVEEHH